MRRCSTRRLSGCEILERRRLAASIEGGALRIAATNDGADILISIKGTP